MIDAKLRDAIQSVSDDVDAERRSWMDGAAGREYALALTKLDEAFMWLVAAQDKASK